MSLSPVHAVLVATCLCCSGADYILGVPPSNKRWDCRSVFAIDSSTTETVTQKTGKRTWTWAQLWKTAKSVRTVFSLPPPHYLLPTPRSPLSNLLPSIPCPSLPHSPRVAHGESCRISVTDFVFLSGFSRKSYHNGFYLWQSQAQAQDCHGRRHVSGGSCGGCHGNCGRAGLPEVEHEEKRLRPTPGVQC